MANNRSRACAHKVFTDGRDIFCSVQETTTKVCPKAHRGGVTQKWAKYVSSLRVEQEPVRSSLLLVACGAQWRNSAPRAANPTTFLFNHRKNFVCTGPSQSSSKKKKSRYKFIQCPHNRPNKRKTQISS